MDEAARRRRVFISYAPVDPHHVEQVRRFAELLREQGVDVRQSTDPELRRVRWTGVVNEIKQADYVVVVASPAYRETTSHNVQDSRYTGPAIEIAVLTDLLDGDSRTWARRLLRVVLPDNNAADFPDHLHAHTGRLFPLSSLTEAALTPIVAAIEAEERPEFEFKPRSWTDTDIFATALGVASLKQRPRDNFGLGDGGDEHVGALVGVMTVPVSIYLGDGTEHAAVEAAVEGLLRASGLAVIDRDDPVAGSWFRRMRAGATKIGRSELGMTARHAAETHLVHAQDAEVTARLMEHLAPVIESLREERNAVVRIGALLIVKVDDNLSVVQLTPVQQYRLNHEPHLLQEPAMLLRTLAEQQNHHAVEAAPARSVLDAAPHRPSDTD